MMTIDNLTTYMDRTGLQFDHTFLREAVREILQLAMEVEVSLILDAAHYERTDRRIAYRNGYRERNWPSSFGELTLRVPKLRQGTYYPSFFDFASVAVEQLALTFAEEIYVRGTYMDTARTLLSRLGMPDVPRNHLVDMCTQLDNLILYFKSRPIRQDFPYVWLDSLLLDSSERVLVAVGVTAGGELVLLSCDTSLNWRTLLHQLRERGLKNVELFISDDDRSAQHAVETIFVDARWQYCRAYALQDILRHVPRPDHAEVVNAIASVFVQDQPDTAASELCRVLKSMSGRFPRAAMQLAYVGASLLEYLRPPTPEPAAATSIMSATGVLRHDLPTMHI